MAFLPVGPAAPQPALNPGLANDVPLGGMTHPAAPSGHFPGQFIPGPGGIHWFGPGGFGIVHPQIAPNPIAQAAQQQAFAQAAQQLGLQNAPSPTSADRQLAEQLAQNLNSAIAAAKDPNLQASLASALGAIHKHIAGIEKEHQQALQGKVSPRLMQHAYGRAGL